MDSASVEPDLILTRRQADGAVEWTPIEIPHRIEAAAGESYALIERAEFAAPPSLVAQRQGDALIVKLGDTEAVVVEGFFLTADVTFHPNPDIAGGAGPFSGPALSPDTTAIATSPEGLAVLWSTGEIQGDAVGRSAESEDDEAEASDPSGGGGGSPALWGGLALGGLALAAAGGGGGGGGGGGSGGGGSGGGGGTDTTAPQITSPATAAPIDENSGSGQTVYRATATDASAVNFSLASSGDAAAFDIDANSGEVTLTENPDFESQSSYSFTVIATDAAGNTARQDVSLSINNLDDAAPTITSGATAAPIDEETGAGQVVYTATADDEGDISGGVTFSLDSSADAADFDIDPNSGEVTLTENPDFETQSSYSFTVIATDAAGNSDQQTVSLEIVDRDESAPIFTSGFTADPIDENSGADQTVYTATATDEQDIVFSLAASGDADAFEIDPDSGEVTLTENPDFESQSSYSFAVIATDAEDNSRQLTVSLDINNLDEVAPNITSGATAPAIDENSGAGQVIYDANATDTGDISGGVTFSLGSGGDDADFTINAGNGQVTLTENPNFEDQESYTFTVIATDAAGNSDQQTVTLDINNLDEVAPTITSGATAPAIDENSGAGQVVYDANATDAGDISGGVTFSLGSGGDEADFTINAGNGQVTLTENPNFEDQESYTFTVIASDAAGNSDQQTVTLDVNNLDEVAPNITSGATAPAIDENSGAGQVVYDANATDTGDISGGVTFSLGSGGDEADFDIDPNTGEVTLTENPDFETQPSYTFTVIATDAAGNSDQQTVSLEIVDRDESAPIFTSGFTADPIDENSGADQVVYTATATDDQDIVFSLATTGDADAFEIDPDSGEVTLTEDPDFEAQPSYSFTVIATDQAGNSRQLMVTLEVNNLDELPPNITSGATASTDENVGTNQVVYDANAADSGDISGGVTFSLGSGDDEADFTINASNGQVRLTENPDFETQPSYTFTVIATDAAGNTDQQTVTLDVNNLDEVAPTITSGATAPAIDENSGAGQVIYDANATDTGDISGGVTFSLGSGGDDADFTINAGNGQVTLTENPNFEDQETYTFTVIATDAAGNSDEQTVSLSINDLDEAAPVFTSGTTAAAIDENSGADQVVYDADATDAGTVTYTLANTGDVAALDIDGSTGEVTLTEDPDFETQSSYTFTVVATDNEGNSSQRTVGLNINNLDEVAPTITSGATAPAIDENSGAGQVVYDANATDAGDISGGVTFSLGSGGDEADFTINAGNGQVTLTENPNFEDQESYTFTVIASDAAGNSDQQTVTLDVNNLDEVAPTITSGATVPAIDENSGAGQVVYDANATDTGDISGGVTFSLGSGGDEAEFTINAGNGQVTLTENPNFEDQESYTFTVIATDAAGNSDQQTVTLDVNNLDEVAPNITSGATAPAIDENSGAGQVVYDANATDAGDISGGVTFSLGSGGDEADFTINAGNGQVTLTENPNFETQPSYTFTVIATDAAGNSDQQTVSLDINDIDETAPMMLSIDDEDSLFDSGTKTVAFDFGGSTTSESTSRSFDLDSSLQTSMSSDGSVSLLGSTTESPRQVDALSTWSGGEGLGSDDRITLVASYDSSDSSTEIAAWREAVGSASVAASGDFLRIVESTDGAGFSLTTWDANTGPFNLLDPVYMTFVTSALPTSQGLA